MLFFFVQIMLFDETDDPILLPTSSDSRRLARRAQKEAERVERRRLREERRLEKLQRSQKPTVDADGDVEMSDVYDDEDEDSREGDDDEMSDEEDDEDEDDFDDEDMEDDGGDDMEFDEDDEAQRAKRRRRGFARLGASTHAFSSAGLLYALSTKINKDSNEYLWNGILGITDQLIHQRIDRRRYLINLTHFRNEVARLNLEDDEINSGRGSNATESHRIVRDLFLWLFWHLHRFLPLIPCFQVFVEREYSFMIYRQWNLYESMCHTRHLAVRLTLWSAQGIKKLETWLAKLGLPLEQVKQPWKAMNPELKQLLPALLEKKTGELDLDSLFYPSFVRKPLFDKEVAASDTVWAVSALLESTKRLKMQQTTDLMSTEPSSSTAAQDFTKSNFWNAYFALSTYDFFHIF
jgi:cell division control protein 45